MRVVSNVISCSLQSHIVYTARGYRSWYLVSRGLKSLQWSTNVSLGISRFNRSSKACWTSELCLNFKALADCFSDRLSDVGESFSDYVSLKYFWHTTATNESYVFFILLCTTKAKSETIDYQPDLRKRNIFKLALWKIRYTPFQEILNK